MFADDGVESIFDGAEGGIVVAIERKTASVITLISFDADRPLEVKERSTAHRLPRDLREMFEMASVYKRTEAHGHGL